MGPTLKAPLVQSRGNGVSGAPGRNHLSHTAPFPFALRHRGLVNNHHRAPGTTYLSTSLPLLPLITSFLLGTHCSGREVLTPCGPT